MAQLTVKGVFFRPKPVEALLVLAGGKGEWYASSLAKEIDCTFPHVIKVLALFRELGLVSFKDRGRKKLVFLSDRGKQLAADFSRALKP